MNKSTTMADIALISNQDSFEFMEITGSDIIYLSPAVIRFAMEMEKRLNANIHKKDNFQQKKVELFEGLEAAMTEFRCTDQSKMVEECADIANYAMFIALNKMDGRYGN